MPRGRARSRARFAQNTLKPEELNLSGSAGAACLAPADVYRSWKTAMSRFDAALEPGQNNSLRANISALPTA